MMLIRIIILVLALLWGGAGWAETINVSPAGGSSSITAGGTPVTCSSGTTGVLFQSSGKVACNNTFTDDGAGLVSMAGPLQFLTSNPGIIKAINFGNVAIWSGSTFFNVYDGSGGVAISPTGTTGVFTWLDNTGSNFNRMQFGGTTSSFPSLKRNGAALESRLADDSASGGIIASTIAATLAAATGTNAVCNTPGTNTALSVQVWATGCAASSARFKDAITALDREKAFETILALQPVSYFYKPEFNMGSDRHIGFTAEQVGSVDPSLITFEDDGVTPHAVKYNEMAPLFAAAIQQLKADNDNLRTEIEELKRRVH